MSHPLLAEAERLLDQENLDPDELIELARRAQRHPPTDQAEGRSLLAMIETLTRRTASELQLMQQALKQAGSAKKALDGYGYMKAQRKNQRANKVV